MSANQIKLVRSDTSPCGFIARDDGGCVVHVASSAEQLPQIAAAVLSLDDTEAFGQIVLDLGDEPRVQRGLADLSVEPAVHRLDAPRADLVNAFRNKLAETPCVAVMLH